MNKVILAFRYSVLVIIVAPAIVLLFKYVHWWWLCCSTEPDPLYLVTAEEIVVKAGDHDVLLPKGLVLYPVNEQEKNDGCHPGGHYKIYISLETDGSNLNTIGWPKGITNLIHQLKK